MSILLIEGFDSVATAQDLFAGILSGAAATEQSVFAAVPTSTFTGKALGISTASARNAASTARAMMSVSTSSPTCVVGAGVSLSPNPHAGYDVGIMNGLSCHVFCRFSLNTVRVYRGDPLGTSVLLGTATTDLPSNGWGYVEIRVVLATDTSGSITVYANGIQTANVGSVVTSADQTVSITGIALGVFDMGGDGFTGLYDNIYMLDDQGPAPNNSVLGPVRVVTRFPGSNAGVQFTPSGTSSNWQAVSENAFDADASYNAASIVPSTDTFAASALPSTTSEIFAIAVQAAVRRDDAGNRVMNTTLVSGGTVASGVPVPLSASYRYINDIFPVDPHTGAAWTATGANASTFGYTVSG